MDCLHIVCEASRSRIKWAKTNVIGKAKMCFPFCWIIRCGLGFTLAKSLRFWEYYFLTSLSKVGIDVVFQKEEKRLTIGLISP